MLIKNGRKKFFSWIFLLVFFFITGYFFSWEYQEFLAKNEEKNTAQRESQLQLSRFSLPKDTLSSEGNLYFTPQKTYLHTFIQHIQQASIRVYINVYMLTEKWIRSALVDAKKRWVDVKVILEKNVYDSAGINEGAYTQLLQAWIDIIRSSNDEYSLDHAKYFLIDNLWIISTGNLTASTFSSNRDIFFETKDNTTVSFLEKIFLADFNKNYSPIYADSLVVSPWYSRKKLETFFQSAQQSIDIYMPYMNDSSLAQILLSQLKKGITLRIVTGKNDVDDSFFQEIQNLGGKVVFLKKTIHAKSVVVDGKILYLGSENFSTPSLDENKELGIFLSSPYLIQQWEKVFNSDL